MAQTPKRRFDSNRRCARRSGVVGEEARSLRRGFTIVELLIVVVVIAILAAITIVSYNGINNRAKASAASSAAQQAAKKVMTYATLNADHYPGSLVDAGVTEGSAAYQYRFNNDANPSTFCVTATTQNVSYFVSETQTAPKAGACAGHGVDGGGTITNLATMPIATLGWAHGAGNGGTATRSLESDARFPGSTAYQVAWSTGPTSSSNLYVSEAAPITCVVGQQYSFYVRYATSWSVVTPGFYFNGPATGVTATSVSRGDGTYEARATWTATPSCTATFTPFLTLVGGSTLPPAAATLRVGGFMVVGGSTQSLSYADGNSSGWAWSGAQNNSLSSGPAL